MIFCGLGINNTMMYNQVKKTWAKQSVALDVSTSIRPLFIKDHCGRHKTAFFFSFFFVTFSELQDLPIQSFFLQTFGAHVCVCVWKHIKIISS